MDANLFHRCRKDLNDACYELFIIPSETKWVGGECNKKEEHFPCKKRFYVLQNSHFV